MPLDKRVWFEARTLRDAGWRVLVIGPRGGPGMRRLREDVDGVVVLRYPQREASGFLGYLLEYPPSMAFTLAWLLWARMTGPIDVIHGCNPPDLFWLFGKFGRLWGGRYVFDQHDMNPELSLTKFGDKNWRGKLLHGITRLLEARSYSTADLILSTNETCRDIALRRGRLPPHRVLVLPNMPDVAAHRALAAGIQPNGRGVGYVGVMGDQDGIDLLVEAWAIMKREADLDDARLDLVGDGPARATAERRAVELGVAESIRFWGFQPPERYVPILARSLVGVSPDPPTPFNHVSSMVKIVDYMAIGRACVAFPLRETQRLGGDAIRYAAGPGAEGLANTLRELIRDPTEALRIGRRGWERVDVLLAGGEQPGSALVKAYSELLKARTRAVAGIRPGS